MTLVTAGTNASKLPLTVWFWAAYLMRAGEARPRCATPAGRAPRLAGAHRVLPPFPGDATSRFQAPDGSAMGRFGCRQP